MAQTLNMGGSIEPTYYAYDQLHPLHPPGHTALPEWAEFVCNLGQYDPVTKKLDTRDFQQVSVHSYPSPPPTNSHPKRSVPLPSLIPNGEFTCCVRLPGHFGGILDSPVVMKHEPLGCHAPISPPPTLPTPTLALPPTDDTLPSISEQDNLDLPLLELPRSSDHDDGAVQQLLSPLSPEWETNRITSDMPIPHSVDNCILLHENHTLPSGSSNHNPVLCQPSSQLSQPVSSLLGIPSSSYPSWDQPLSSLMDTDFDDDLELGLSTPSSLPSSSHPRNLNSKSDLIFENHYPDEKYPSCSYTRSPLISHINTFLELDDTPLSPSSPSLRSFSSLPEVEMDEDEDLHSTLYSPSSPSQPLISLPGADADEDLIPADLASRSFAEVLSDVDFLPIASHSKRSLLLLDDPNDVPPPRSPSPENFHLDPALLENCTDPEVQRLCDLRKKSQTAERNARQLENLMLDEGSPQMRWEARKTRKREKERSREISAMLRLKLAESGLLDEQALEKTHPSKRDAINSMEQLVAKMLLRRNDTSRSLAHRRISLSPKEYLHSPLARSVASDSNGLDEDSYVSKDEDSSLPPEWPMDLDQNGYLLREQ